MRLLALVALMLTLCAYSCIPMVQQREHIFSARQLEPEAWYEDIYDKAHACAKVMQRLPGKAPYAAIEWYVVPKETMHAYIDAIGLWSEPNRIYIDERYVVEGGVIRHELLHYILQGGDSVHTSAAFLICNGMIAGSAQ